MQNPKFWPWDRLFWIGFKGFMMLSGCMVPPTLKGDLGTPVTVTEVQKALAASMPRSQDIAPSQTALWELKLSHKELGSELWAQRGLRVLHRRSQDTLIFDLEWRYQEFQNGQAQPVRVEQVQWVRQPLESFWTIALDPQKAYYNLMLQEQWWPISDDLRVDLPPGHLKGKQVRAWVVQFDQVDPEPLSPVVRWQYVFLPSLTDLRRWLGFCQLRHLDIQTGEFKMSICYQMIMWNGAQP